MFRLPTKTDSDGKRLSDNAVDKKIRKARQAVASYLKKDYNFHHGELEIPDPDVDPSVRSLLVVLPG